jgi:hypothetical protein
MIEIALGLFILVQGQAPDTRFVQPNYASDLHIRFAYIGVGLCGASGTHFTGLVRVCRLTPELPFKGLFVSAKFNVVGAQRSHLFLSRVLGPSFTKLGKGV